MKLDIEIDSCDCIGRYVSELYRIQSSYLAKKFEKLDIGSGQYLFLLHLYKHKGITQEKLTEVLNVDKATTTRAIKKLEQVGYVEKIKREDDKRAYNLRLTNKALNIEEDFFQILDTWNEKVHKVLSSEENEVLLKLLKKVTLSEL